MAYSALEVSKWILFEAKKRGIPMTHMRLQKYLFYAQAYGSKHNGGYFDVTPLFKENIIADSYGPIVREVFEEYHKYGLDPIEGAETKEAPKSKIQAIQRVFDDRGHLSDTELSRVVRDEQPWWDTPRGEPINAAYIYEILVNEESEAYKEHNMPIDETDIFCYVPSNTAKIEFTPEEQALHDEIIKGFMEDD